MELVPQEELETNSFLDRRAKKVIPQGELLIFYPFWHLLVNVEDVHCSVLIQIARFKRQKAAESKLLEIKERKERIGRSTKASALSTPVLAEEDELDNDGEEEREVSSYF